VIVSVNRHNRPYGESGIFRSPQISGPVFGQSLKTYAEGVTTGPLTRRGGERAQTSPSWWVSRDPDSGDGRNQRTTRWYRVCVVPL